ncbi:Os10g0107200 [Oryza sativa Japonica Group]|uniref:Os10g0107200 protein n=1 Tax=Oryza sativa subsp. japonica TaxID=39947 RepID=A0A0N7KRC2_ORYSJ|nr:Os10g0107200 [Oryza sativa Japonica Group]
MAGASGLAITARVRHFQSTAATASNAVMVVVECCPPSSLVRRPRNRRMWLIKLVGTVTLLKVRSNGLRPGRNWRRAMVKGGTTWVATMSSCLTGTMDGEGSPRASSPTACMNCAMPTPSARPWLHVTPTTKPPQDSVVTCTHSRGGGPSSPTSGVQLKASCCTTAVSSSVGWLSATRMSSSMVQSADAATNMTPSSLVQSM